jgi:hypothetical protein
LVELQVIARPVSTLLLASRVVAVAWVVSPVVNELSTRTTLTDATGATGALTEIVADAIFPSLEAEICTVPAAIAVTRPSAETVPMLALLEVQLIARPVRMLLLASRVTALSCTVPPICKFAVPGDTDTNATGAGGGALTVIVEVAVWPSLVAVICTVPAAIVVTRPRAETVPMLALFELQLITRPVRTLLLASRVTADNCTVPPIWRLEVAGDTDIDATGTGAGALTAIAAEEVCPSLAAMIDAFPPATAVTSPEVETVAMPLLLELQPITRPVRTLLLASLVTADSWTDAPTCRLALAGDTDTDATGIGAGALTVRREEFVLPVLEALIIDWPGPTAFTVPVVSTVATLMSELSQIIVRPVIGLPLESASVAVAFAV